MTTAELQSRTLKRGQKVRLVGELPGVASGSHGKVAMANGFTWHRYWVRFNDGQVIGHIDHENLVLTKHYDRFLVAREREAEQALNAPVELESDTPDAASQTASSDGGGDAIVNGVTIPAYLLQRSADARIRLGA